MGEDSRTFNWPNAGFEFEFSGTKAEVYVDYIFLYGQGNLPNEGCYFNVAVYDGDTLKRVTRMELSDGWNTIYTYQDGDPEIKKIMLVRSSEALRGVLTMNKLRCDDEPKASEQRERLIESIGDSFTVGYGNSPELEDPKADAYCAQNTDNWNSYTGMVARHYQADNTVIAHSGKGAYKNNTRYPEQAFVHTMSDQFGYEEIYVNNEKLNMSGEEEHKFYKYQPQLVTIWLGTNDASDYSSYDSGLGPVDTETFKTAYEKLLGNVRDKYPNAVILNMSIDGSAYCETIKSVVDNAGGGQNKYYMLVLNPFTTKSYDHPDIAEDERIAEQIIAKVDSIPDVWETPTEGENDTQLLSLRVNYNTSEVNAYGITKSGCDYVSAVVTKPGETLTGDTNYETDIAFLSQVTTNSAGEYSFEFKVDKLEGEYTFHLNSVALNNQQKIGFTFKNLIPAINVTSGGKPVIKMSDLSDDRDLKVALSGFDVEDGFKGMLVVAQYKGRSLKLVNLKDASSDSQLYGKEIILDVNVADDTDKIKVFYLNKTSIVPLIGSYDIVQ